MFKNDDVAEPFRRPDREGRRSETRRAILQRQSRREIAATESGDGECERSGDCRTARNKDAVSLRAARRKDAAAWQQRGDQVGIARADVRQQEVNRHGLVRIGAPLPGGNSRSLL